LNFFTWRSAILKSDLQSTTKLVLLVISTYMDDHGGGAFPSTRTIANDASLSQKAVLTHVEKAQEAGFLIVFKKKQRGQDWALNHYKIAFPVKHAAEGGSAPSENQPDCEGAERGSAPFLQASETQAEQGLQSTENKVLNEGKHLLGEGAERRSKGAEPQDQKVLNDVQHNSPKNSPSNSPEKPSSGARENFKSSIPSDWQPSCETFEALTAMGVPGDFSFECLLEFKLYWRDDGRPKTSWNSAFHQKCLSDWRRSGAQWRINRCGTSESARVMAGLSDRSWADHLITKSEERRG